MDAQACRVSCSNISKPTILTSGREHRSRMLSRLLGILVPNRPSNHRHSISSISYARNRKDGRFVSRWLCETRSLQRWSATSRLTSSIMLLNLDILLIRTWYFLGTTYSHTCRIPMALLPTAAYSLTPYPSRTRLHKP